MIFRRANPDDIDAIVDLAMESVSRDPLPVKRDREAMTVMAKATLNPAHFLWVTEINGEIVAAVAACVQKSFWFRGMQASVLLCYSRNRGAGLGLIREFVRWCKSRSGIKVAVIELEPSTDPRLIRFMKTVGFSREGTNLSYVRMQ